MVVLQVPNLHETILDPPVGKSQIQQIRELLERSATFRLIEASHLWYTICKNGGDDSFCFFVLPADRSADRH